jgi:hypothetical protein
LAQAVIAHIRDKAGSASITPAIQHLAAVPTGLVITLNYDDLIERAAREAGREVVALGLDQVRDLVAEGRPRDDVLRVIHLHGDVRSLTAQIVLDEPGYRDRLFDGRVDAVLSAFVYDYTLVFLGTSLREPHLLTALSKLRAKSPRHVFVCEHKDAAKAATGALDSPLTPSQNLQTCSYPDGDHEVLDSFLSRLVERSRSKPSATRAVDHKRDPYYTERTLLRTDNLDDPRVDLLFGRGELISEDELGARSRAVVVGAAGSGKTQLLRHLAASLTKPGNPSSVVSLRKVSDLVGTPAYLLEAWLGCADNAHELSPEHVLDGRQPLHLFLDGLDELVPRQREAAVVAIDRVAGDFPHIRLTVTSRPAAALARFSDAWQHFELVCDRGWQESFLTTAGTDSDSLKKRLGDAAQKLDPLLNIPFYLRRLVEASDTAIKSAVEKGDAAGVVLALLDDLLASDETLHPIATAVRPWIERCALAMQLTGERQLQIGTLEQLAVGIDLGDVEELAQRLSARSLLQDSANTWTFEHRILAEALVAKILAPQEPAEWLQVIAPTFDGHSGLREDWREIASFLAQRDRRWRSAIASRDSLMAARLTPAHAPLEERIHAAKVIWQHAKGRQIWLEGGVADADDDVIVSRLLPRPAPPHFIREFEANLSTGSRYDRANAMDLLVRLQPASAAKRLGQSLRSEPDSTVRRNSARWIRKLGLFELRHLVTSRATRSADEAEAGDMATIALGMARPSERLELAVQLLAAGNTQFHDHHVLEDASPMEKVRWWLRAAQADPERAEFGGTRDLSETLDEITEASDQDAADVAELAAILGSPVDERIKTWVASHARGSAIGLARATEHEGAFYAAAHWLGLEIGSSALRAAGASEDLVEWVVAREGFDVLEARARAAAAELPRRGVQVRQLTLEEALSFEDDEAITALLDREHAFLRTLQTTPKSTRSGLLSLIDRAWGRTDLGSAIAVADDRARLEPWAILVLAYGPAVGMRLDDDRWQQVALCGWLFHTQHDWLRAQATMERLDAATVAAAGDLRGLFDLLKLAPEDSKPSALLARITSLPDAEWGSGRSDALLERLAAMGAVAQIRTLSRRNSDLAARTASLLAQAGDVAAQQIALEGLRQRLSTGDRPSAHNYPFLAAIRSGALLQTLLEVFILAGKTPHEYDPFDVENALLAAIQRIGGSAAIDGLTTIATSPRWDGAQWHFRAVDAMVQQLLIAPSLRAAEPHLRALGLCRI